MTTAILEASPPAATARPEAARHAVDLRGLALLAVALIVLCGAGEVGNSILPGGYVGADVLLAVAGFASTAAVVVPVGGAAPSGGRLAHFYARTVRATLPSVAVVLVCTLALAAILLPPSRTGRIASDALWSGGFVGDLRFARMHALPFDTTVNPTPFEQFWLIAVLAQLCILWPALLALTTRRDWSAASARAVQLGLAGCVMAASLVWSVHQTSVAPLTAYFSPLTRAWEFAAGAALALAFPHRPQLPRGLRVGLTLSGIALILVAARWFTALTAYPGHAAGVPVCGALLVITAAHAQPGPPAVATMRLMRPLRTLGSLWLPWYLWQWPVLVIAAVRYPAMGTAARAFLGFGSLMLAAISYRLAQRPVDARYARGTISLRGVFATVTVLGVLAAYANAFIVTNSDRVENARQDAAAYELQPQNSPGTASVNDVENAVAIAVNRSAVAAVVAPPLAVAVDDAGLAYSGGCVADASATTSRICRFGTLEPGTPRVVLIGDASAAQWLPALVNVAGRTPIAVYMTAHQGCAVTNVAAPDAGSTPTQSGSAPSAQSGSAPSARTCATWRHWLLGAVKALHPTLVVVSDDAVTSSDVPAATSAGAARVARPASVVAALGGVGGRVVLLTATPRAGSAVPQCLASHPDAAQTCAAHPVPAELVAVARTAATVAGAALLDVTPLLCAGNICPAVIANRVVYRDGHNLTATYSSYLGHALGTALGLEATASSAAAAVEAALRIHKVPASARSELQTGAYGPGYPPGCASGTSDGVANPAAWCTLGDSTSRRTLALFGDVDAMAWIPALQAMGSLYGWKVEVIAGPACDVPAAVRTALAGRTCAAWTRSAVEAVSAQHPARIVMAAGDGDLLNAAGRLARGSSAVSIIGPAPVMQQSAIDCLQLNDAKVQRCTTPRHRAVSASAIRAAQQAARNLRAQYVDVTDWLCDARSCPATIGGSVAYQGPGIVSGSVAVAVSAALAGAMGMW